MSFYNDASLIFLPNAGKDTKAYSAKPTDGSGDFTFSRGSNLTATRVGPTGLIEKGRENLLLQSNAFSTSPWSEINTTLTSGQSGYDGSSDAWLLEAASDGPSRYVGQNVSSSGVNTFSCYAKAGTTDYIRIQINAGSTAFAYFDLTAGVADSTLNEVTTNIEAVSGATGWYRCSLVANDSSITAVRIYVAQENSVNVITGDNIYIQSSQLEIGLAATDYIESGASTGKAGLLEDSPRFDYSGGASCPALLLEPQRSNIVTQSEYFADVYWSKSNVSTELADIASPEGKNNSYKITETTANGQHAINIFSSYRPTLTAGSHTHSCFVKANGVNDIIFYNNGSSGGGGVNVNLSDGTYSNLTGAATSASVEPYGNDWFRISLTFTALAGTSAPTIYLRALGSYTGDGVSGIYMYGMQTEEGSYPTSYIPNHSGGSVTRNADNNVLTGVGSLIDSTQGTIYFEGKSIYSNVPNYSYFLSLSDGTQSNRLELRQSVDEIQFLWRVGGVYQNNITTNGITITDTWKLAIKYSNDAIKMFYNGSLIGTISSPTLYSANTLNRLAYDDGAGNNDFQGYNNKLLLFPTALTDQEAIDLTTL